MKFSHFLEQSPHDWETTMHQNKVLTICHTQNIRHHAWKTVRTTVQCIVDLKKWKNYGTNLFYSYSSFLNLLPRIGEHKHQSMVLTVFHAWWQIFCVWKLVRIAFWCIIVSQLQGDCSRMYENFMDSGSMSATYAIRNMHTIQGREVTK